MPRAGASVASARVRLLPALAAYLVFVFGGAALVAPWIHLGVQSLAAAWPALAGLADAPFHRFVNRCVLVLALAGLWLLLRALGVRRWRDLGWSLAGTPGRDFSLGLAVSLLGLALVAATALATGVRAWRPEREAGEIAGQLLRALSAAVVVATIEETLFRGALFRALRREGPFALAAAVTAAVYAWVHFFERPPRPDAVGPWTGFVTLGLMLRGFVHWDSLVPGWLTLFVVGWVLARAVESRGSLWLALGLHAGWIFWIKSYGFWTVERVPEAARWLGTARLTDGWFALAVVLATGLAIRRHSAAVTGGDPASRP